MKTIFKTPALFLIGCSFVFQSNAQPDLSKFEWGILVSGYVYQGDLTPSTVGSYNTIKPGVSLFFSKEIIPRISLRTNVAIGGLKGDDAKYSSPDWRKERALIFKTPVIEISELAVINPLTQSRVNPYLFGGVGLTLLNIHRDWSRFNAIFFSNQPKTLDGLSKDIQESVPKRIIVLPFGVGVKYPLNDHISLMVESAYRVTFTDYLDGFSEVANPDKKDYYFTHSIGISYQPGFNLQPANRKRLDCPTF